MTMHTIGETETVAADLAAWTKGIYCSEAAVMLLVRAFGGRFARPGWPWIANAESGSHYIDAKNLGDDEIGMLSVGERRVLAITRSLFSNEPVDLSDALTGLDQPTSRLVINALAHATGSRGTITTRTPSRGVGRTRELG